MIRRLSTLALLAAACTGASTGASTGAGAQTMTVFGIFDAAVERVSNVGSPGASLSRMPSLTGSVPSRIGLRGSEDLGVGVRAIFVLEEGFTPDLGTMSQGGRAWGRQALVAVVGPWGTVGFGRQYTMLYWSLLDADILGPAIYGTGSLDAYIPNSRADNAFSWRGTFGAWTLGATYSLGRDSVNAGSPAGTNCGGESSDSKACREWSVLGKFDSPRWGAALAVDEIRGGPGAFAGLASSALKDRRVSANGYAVFGPLKLSLGLVRRANDASVLAPKSDLWYLGAAWAATPALTLDGEWLRLEYKTGPDRATLGAARATYSLSRRTAVYATFGHIANRGTLALSVSAGAGGSNPAVGAVQSGLATGLRHSF